MGKLFTQSPHLPISRPQSLAQANDGTHKSQMTDTPEIPNRPNQTLLPDTLLATKLYIPALRPKLVARDRLVQRLNQGLQRDSGVTLISAPPGFGKTTLLSEWIDHLGQAEKLTRPVAWVSLDEGDNNPQRLLTYCIAALQKIHPAVGAEALAKTYRYDTTAESFLTTLINEMMVITEPFLFVIDDYHVIEAPIIHEGLNFLLDNLPPQVQLVIATRTEPPVPLARLRARGQLTELHAADLTFNPAEAAEFLNQVMGLNLSTEEVEALETRTEGWIAGLQMAALSMQGLKDTAAFVRAFTGTHRYILDYLLEEVLNRQPDLIQNFLLKTSILARLTGPLCDVLIADIELPDPEHPNLHNGREILKFLEQSNLFIVPLDDERHWYRYHHLFADLLHGRLKQQRSEPEIANLHRRAGDWYQSQGLATEAMRHALAAVDTPRIVELVKRQALPLLNQSELEAALSWLKNLSPEMTRAWSRGPLLSAWAMVLTGEFETLKPRLQELEQQLALERQAAAGVDQANITGEIEAIYAFVAYFQRDLPQAIQLCRQALEHLPASNLYLRGILMQSLATALSWRGEINQAIRAYSEASAINQAAGNKLVALLALWSLGQMRVEQGNLRQAAEVYHEALNLTKPMAHTEQPEDLPNPARIYIRLAELSYQQNDLKAARQNLTTGLEALEAGQDFDIQSHAYLVLARLKRAQADLAGAAEAIQQAVLLARQQALSEYWATQVTLNQARLWLHQGNLKACQSWAVEHHLWPVSVPVSIPYLREAEYLLLVRLLLASAKQPPDPVAAQLDAALDILEKIEQAARSSGRQGRLIEILILKALALEPQQDLPQALDSLEEALSLAGTEGIVRVFVDEGEPLMNLLRRLLARGGTAYRVFANKLLALLTTAASPPPPLLDALSERELEILRLTATGMSNQKLADALVLTVGTVKWHLNNIYSKLGVRSRTEAVARARELGVL